MSIQQTTPQSEINAYLAEQIERLNRAAVRTLCYVGERALTAARNTQSYKDQTGNLRSSLGYVVAVDGRIAQTSNFVSVKSGNEGTKNGEDYIRELVSRLSEGIVLIVVAGMEYAYYVSAKGYDVLDSAEMLAEDLTPRLLKQLGLTA